MSPFLRPGRPHSESIARSGGQWLRSDRNAAPPASLTAASTVRKFDNQNGSEIRSPANGKILSKNSYDLLCPVPPVIRAHPPPRANVPNKLRRLQIPQDSKLAQLSWLEWSVPRHGQKNGDIRTLGVTNAQAPRPSRSRSGLVSCTIAGDCEVTGLGGQSFTN